ncbi:DUF1015 domain-containing protein [Coriobacteriaceae bacterium]|uniref:DUF1015 domain-containing protein n=1 Tax=Granulimonas faecalis TaxID=2894155 RepID=A0AAV5B3U8_9ACTN|nr:DUF1015 family protein [Granulimonas faecalis]TGY58396.1 DUF1015 domain-containing protein [Coriobacteriaceae bacterium]GJM55718.1 hypothetical protein ATOP_13730 [Granulimonas faecalis]
MHIHPFAALRPAPELAARTAALPYDVVDLEEARRAVGAEPLSFLGVDVPGLWVADGGDPDGEEACALAARRFAGQVEEGVYRQDGEPTFYVYREQDGGRSQTGLVACVAVDDFVAGAVRRHENTRREKELGRVRHIRALSAQTGPVFLAYRADAQGAGRVAAAVETVCAGEPLYDFTDAQGVRNTVWRVDDRHLRGELADAASEIPGAYIADGHHRAASAVRVAMERREGSGAMAGRDAPAGSEAASDTVMAVLFPADGLDLLSYNRVVADRAGLGAEELVDAVGAAGFEVAPVDAADAAPTEPGTFGMCCGGAWYRLTPSPALAAETAAADAADALDVAVLQDRVLGPVLGIADPRQDPRLDFVGGNRGTTELERLAGEGGVAFVCHPTSMDELMAVADEGRLMPPKSTWFEPKLRSGLFFHRI